MAVGYTVRNPSGFWPMGSKTLLGSVLEEEEEAR